jgi:alpha-tubulin suppressor-like RCC1 family protein
MFALGSVLSAAPAFSAPYVFRLSLPGIQGLGTSGTTQPTFKQIMSGARQVSAGYASSVILGSDGSIWASGYNNYGQLGDGSTTSKSTLEQVQTGVSQISAGMYHVLALKSDGSVWVTGNNNSGELGNGDSSKTAWTTYGQVMAGGVQKVVAGGFHSVILKTDSTLWVAGVNTYGGLGDGSTASHFSFEPVLSNVTQVAAGSYHTLAILGDGSLWATGENNYGQLGIGSTTNALSWTQVKPLP